MDRRNKDRHDLQLLCRFGSAKVLSAPLEGMTENMSRDGILMRWLDAVPLPEIGADLTVEVDLPGGSGFGPRVMRCATTVVRITGKQSGHTSVGLRINKVRFSRAAKKRTYDLAAMQPATDKVN